MSYQSTHELPGTDQQVDILGAIVEAMMDAQDELGGASPEQWARILRESCRDRKAWAADDCGSLIGTC